MVSIAIDEENIDSFRYSIAKNSDEEVNFIKKVKHTIKSVDISDISDPIKRARSTSASCLPLRQSNTMINNISILTTCRMHFILPSISMRLLTNLLPPSLPFQKKNSDSPYLAVITPLHLALTS